MKKQLAVAMTAAFLLAGAGLPASAQDETITVEGVIFLDHNSNEKYDQGETVRANGPGVWAKNLDTNQTVGEFGTDANGRYKAVLPKGPRYLIGNRDVNGFGHPWAARPADKDLTLDFPLWGSFIDGFSFVDANGDGVKQADEKVHGGKVTVTGEAHTDPKTQVKVEAEVTADGSYHVELPEGDYTVTAPDLTQQGLALAKPLGANDIDWLTGQRTVGGDARNTRVDARYFEPKADIGVEASVVPAKDSYVVGEQADIKLVLSNKGDLPVRPSFVMASFHVKLLSSSSNVKAINGHAYEFETVDKILPGDRVEVVLKAELNDTAFTEVWPIVRFNFGYLKDVDHKNNVVRLPVEVVEKSTTTPTTSTSPSETTAPTTTTTPAVAKAGNNSRLASTGASVLGFLGLGALLLAGGLGALFVARRRRS